MMPADGRGYELSPAMAFITNHDIDGTPPVHGVLADMARRLGTRPIEVSPKSKPSIKPVAPRQRARAKP
jgi:hypothetical protein